MHILSQVLIAYYLSLTQPDLSIYTAVANMTWVVQQLSLALNHQRRHFLPFNCGGKQIQFPFFFRIPDDGQRPKTLSAVPPSGTLARQMKSLVSIESQVMKLHSPQDTLQQDGNYKYITSYNNNHSTVTEFCS